MERRGFEGRKNGECGTVVGALSFDEAFLVGGGIEIARGGAAWGAAMFDDGDSGIAEFTLVDIEVLVSGSVPTRCFRQRFQFCSRE